MIKTLFLAWQAAQPGPQGGPASRAWYPIGRLDSLPEERLFRFAYTGGAQRAQREAGFAALEAFPEFERVYEDDELFTLFQNRLISPRRGDYPAFLERLAMDAEHADPMDVLAISEGRRETDHLEVFPQLKARRDGSFAVRFFLHGWRHVNASAQERLLRLTESEALRVAVELNNPATVGAVQLQTANDYFMLGWAPRYLVTDLLKAMATAPAVIEARVLKMNLEPAPYNQRLLVELTGRFADGFQPMSGPDFQLLVPATAAVH